MSTRRKKPQPPPKIEILPITSLIPDDKNANLGTERGYGVIENSLSEDGAGRGILLDKNLKVVGGNKTVEAAVALGYDEVILVHGDGKRLVAHVRDDLNLDTVKGRCMAITDNRSAQLNLNWSGEVLKDLQNKVDFSRLFNQDEMDSILKRAPSLDELGGRHGAGSDSDLYVTLSLHVAPSTRAKFLEVLQQTPGDDDDQRLLTILESLPS